MHGEYNVKFEKIYWNVKPEQYFLPDLEMKEKESCHPACKLKRGHLSSFHIISYYKYTYIYIYNIYHKERSPTDWIYSEAIVLVYQTTRCQTPEDYNVHIFFPSGPRPPHYRGFAITLRHATCGWTPADEWSAKRTELYLTTHYTHKRKTSMSPVRFGPAIPASERL
jgi:hypothetical protein